MLAIGREEASVAVRVKGKVKACRVEYETKDRTNWKAIILSYTMEDAIAYIRNNVRGFDRYISTGIVGEIDAIDDVVYNDLFVGKTTVIETTVSETTDTEEEKTLTCPWCDKTFLTKITLGNHIKRFHMENK